MNDKSKFDDRVSRIIDPDGTIYELVPVPSETDTDPVETTKTTESTEMTGKTLATEATEMHGKPGEQETSVDFVPRRKWDEIPETPVHREGYYESQICPGLWFDKYRLDVEMDGQADLSALQFAILTLLDDKNGRVDVEFVKTKCWTKHPSRENFANRISELNEKLMNIGVREKTIMVNKGILSFE